MPAGLPTSITVAVEFTAGVWTALTDVVGDSIEIRVGRENAASDIQPGTLSFALDNIDGKYTPDNPTSSLYPSWVEGKRVRVQVVKSGTTYTRFVGRIDRIEPDFPTVPWSSRVTVTAVDLLGDLARRTIRNTATRYAESRASSSTHYYPLDDNGAANVARESRRRRASTLAPRSVSAGGAVEWQGDEFLGMPCVKLTAGKGLADNGGLGTALGGTYGFHLLVRVEDNSYGEVCAYTNGPRSSTTDGILLRWTSSGFILDDLAGGVTVSSSTAIPVEPGWHSVFWEGAVGSNAQLFVDNTFVASISDTTIIGGYTGVSIGGSINMSASMLLFGSLATTTMMNFGTRSVEFIRLIGDGPTSPFDVIVGLGDLDGETVRDPALVDLTASPLLYVDTNGLDLARAVANGYGGGLFYQEYSTSATQLIRFPSTNTIRPATVALTVDAAADLDGGPTMTRESTDRIASATATSSATAVTYIDSTQTDQGDPPEIETFLRAAEPLAAVAQDRVARSAASKLRVSQLTVDLSTAANDLYAAFYAVTPGERVRLSNLPSAYFGVTYMDGYVEGWTERPGVTGYEVTFDLSPADAPPEGIWDDSTYGRWGFGDGVATNVSSATIGATSVQFQWTGGLTLSTAAGDYPLDLDWNGERVTVTSAPAGGSSPQTLTITRGVAPTVARAHNAGESVDIWNAARWAM